MERICGVSYHGALKKAQIEIGKDVDAFFSRKHRDIILYIDGNKYYSHLVNSFFTICRHLRTAYDKPHVKGINRLHEWVTENQVQKVEVEVIQPFKEYKITKIS